MGEILGISNISGNLLCLQIKNLVPYTIAYNLYTTLIKSICNSSPQEIIENFRAQYLIINECVLFVFSSLTENPFLSLDSLYKLKDFLSTITKEFKIELLQKKLVEISYGIEDILNSMDPSGRITKAKLFTISKPFQSLYSSTSNLVYMNKPWKEDGKFNTSAFSKSKAILSSESELQNLSFVIPELPSQPRPPVHPFAAQFIDTNSPEKLPQEKTSIKRMSENSLISPLKSLVSQAEETCKLVIMEKTLVAFQNTNITNLRTVGQIGIELKARSEGKGMFQIQLLDWTDSKKIAKRICNENVKEIDGVSYDIDIGKLKGTCPIIDYIVSPNILDISNFPMFAMYNLEKIHDGYILQIKYQVSSNWKASLEGVCFMVMLNAIDPVLIEANGRGEINSSVLQWKIPKLGASQKGILEARIACSECKVDHTKIQFKSSDANLSHLSAVFTFKETATTATSRFMAEIVISNN